MSAPPLYRVRLRLDSPLGTPLTSGTLFGHLCWAVRERRDDAALTRWLNAQETEPWLVSDGFPAGLLPRPLVRPAPRRAPKGQNADDAKKLARRPWLPLEAFQKLRGALSETSMAGNLVDGPSAPRDHRMAHNSIDRQRGTTPEEGGLYFVDEDWSFCDENARDRDVWVRTTASVDEVKELFGFVGEAGYGRDATWGRGCFTVMAVEPVPDLDAHSGNRMLSLSHGVLTENMRDPRYRLFTHYGKLGPMMAAVEARIWKQPVLLARPGCTFTPEDAGPFGRLLADVHQKRKEVRHDARHVAIPYTEVAP